MLKQSERFLEEQTNAHKLQQTKAVKQNRSMYCTTVETSCLYTLSTVLQLGVR